MRAQFTPLGDYAEDADALSAGGFQQQRLDVQAAVQPGRRTVSAGVRWRPALRSEEDEANAP